MRDNTFTRKCAWVKLGVTSCLLDLAENNLLLTQVDFSAVKQMGRLLTVLGAEIAGLLKKVNCKDVVVAVDGALFRSHPLYCSMVKETVARRLVMVGYDFDMVQSMDGSGLGAAMIAAMEAN